jgi:hypothetical protein
VRVDPLSPVLAPYAKREMVQCVLAGICAFEGYKGSRPPPAALPFPQPFFPPAPSSSSRLAPCPPTRCRSVSAMQATTSILAPCVAWPRPIPLHDPDRVPIHYWSSRTPAAAAATSRSRSRTLPIVKMPHQQPCLNLRPADPAV